MTTKIVVELTRTWFAFLRPSAVKGPWRRLPRSGFDPGDNAEFWEDGEDVGSINIGSSCRSG
jgi:hypothetical protein